MSLFETLVQTIAHCFQHPNAIKLHMIGICRATFKMIIKKNSSQLVKQLASIPTIHLCLPVLLSEVVGSFAFCHIIPTLRGKKTLLSLSMWSSYCLITSRRLKVIPCTILMHCFPLPFQYHDELTIEHILVFQVAKRKGEFI